MYVRTAIRTRWNRLPALPVTSQRSQAGTRARKASYATDIGPAWPEGVTEDALADGVLNFRFGLIRLLIQEGRI